MVINKMFDKSNKKCCICRKTIDTFCEAYISVLRSHFGKKRYYHIDCRIKSKSKGVCSDESPTD